MNAKPKDVQTLECRRCGKTYMMAMGMPIRLSQHRPARDGQGICPDHKQPAQS